MLSLGEISDRLEIQQLLVNYSTAIDQRRFDDLDNVFTADAYIDYRAMGGIDGRFAEVKAWLAEVLPDSPTTRTCSACRRFSLAGDCATARTFCFNPMVFGGAEPTESTSESTSRARRCCWGCGTTTSSVRTPDGWRMSRRAETRCFDR